MPTSGSLQENLRVAKLGIVPCTLSQSRQQCCILPALSMVLSFRQEEGKARQLDRAVVTH